MPYGTAAPYSTGAERVTFEAPCPHGMVVTWLEVREDTKVRLEVRCTC